MKFTKEQIESRIHDSVCAPCGIEFLTDKQKQESNMTTFHVGECCLCKEQKHVTNIRHYNYLSYEVKK